MARSSATKAAAFSALVALLAGATVAAASNADHYPTAVQQRAKFADADFAIDTAQITGNPNDAGNLRAGNVGTFPVLGLPGIDTSFALVTLAANAHNLPHTHPRASETLYLTKGELYVFIVEENSAAPVRVMENTLRPGGVAVFPTGLIHGQRCVAADGCEFVAVLGSGDPGTVTVAARLCDGPAAAVAASFGVSEDVAKKLCGQLPGNPAAGQPASYRR